MSKSIWTKGLAIAVLHAAGAAAAQAQSIVEFPYGKVCNDTGNVDHGKLIGLIAKNIDISKAINDWGQVEQKTFRSLIWKSGLLQAFSLQLRRERGRYYRVLRDRQPEPTFTFNAEELLYHPGSYEIRCVLQSRQPSQTAKLRKRLATRLTKAGDKLILRKDRDGFEKSLEEAAPAKFAATRDRITDNTLFQSEFALATQFTFDVGFDPADPATIATAFPVFLLPYIRQQGTFNSNDKLRDIDNIAAGLMLDAYAIPTTWWLDTSLSLSAEYLTDSSNDKEIIASELVWTPTSPAGVRWPIDLGQRIYFDEIGGGSSIRFDLSGRVRYGRVRNNANIPTIENRSNYTRFGFKSHVDYKVGGDDLFSGFSAHADYLYFSNMRRQADIKNFYRFETGVAYDLSKNHGISLTYAKGRNEDTLQKVDKLWATLTLKFGEVIDPNPTFD